MRILIATTFRTVVGGTETYLRELLPALVERGHELALLYSVPEDIEGSTIDDGLNIPTWRCDVSKNLTEIQHWNPDVCFLHALSPEADEELVNRFRTIFFAHNYYGTCAEGSKCNGWITQRPCTRTFGPACLVLNYTLRCGFRNPMNLWKRYQQQSQRKQLLLRYHRILVASNHMVNEMKQHGVPSDRIVLAPLFTTGTNSATPPVSAHTTTNRILFAGRFTDIKGGDILIRATRIASKRLNHPLRLVFAGSGPEEQTWRSLSERLGVPSEFLGWCSPTQLSEIRRTIDLLAVPSVWPEPFGLVGVEAGIEGLPAVAFAVGGIPDWLIPGISGELAPNPPTAQGLADAMVRALGNPEHYQALRLASLETSKRFSIGRHLNILEKALNS